jgi:hypothetical protein
MTVGYECAFAAGQDRLDDLLEKVAPTTVVTLNYDTLVEEAILRRGLRYSYPALAGPRSSGDSVSDQTCPGLGEAIPVFKLHGSVNWLQLHAGAVSATEEVAERIARERPTRIVKSGPFVAANTWATAAIHGRANLFYELEHSSVAGDVVVAVYGHGKHVLGNPDHVSRHRQACLDRIRSEPIERVLVVGVRPVDRDDDQYINELIDVLGAVQAERIYVSPSQEECEEMKRRSFIPFHGSLEAFLTC